MERREEALGTGDKGVNRSGVREVVRVWGRGGSTRRVEDKGLMVEGERTQDIHEREKRA